MPIVRATRLSLAGVVGVALVWASPARAVTHGTDDTGDPAVVGIVDATGRLTCTGAVIAPHVVLTAAHCTQPSLKGATVVFGPTSAAPTAHVAVAESIAHPSFDPSTLADDVAILVLASSSPASSLPFATTAPGASFIGSSIDIVGYGETAGGAADTGTKRSGTAVVTALDATTLTVQPGPSEPCEGDSGGPALVGSTGSRTIVGVTSHGDSACATQAVYTRVDAFTSFVTGALAQVAPGTALAGARCLYPEICQGGASECLAATDDPGVSYCSRSCASDGDCPSRMTCTSSQCRFPTPTPGALGAACSSDADCLDGTCSASGTCVLRCDPASSMACPDGRVCTNVGGIEYDCVASPTPLPTASGSSCALATAPAAPRGDDRDGLLVAAIVVVVAAHRRVRRYIDTTIPGQTCAVRTARGRPATRGRP